MPANALRSWIKDNPRLYDALKWSKRQVQARPEEPYATLDAYSRRRDGKVRFIQIGANDGLRNDPVREFVVRDRWSGVLVEPLPQVFALLKQNYPPQRFPGLRFVNAAVTARDGETLSFWSVSDSYLDGLAREIRLDYMRKASFDRDHIARFLREGGAPEDAAVEIKVPCMTVETIAREHFEDGRFDLLVIDAEGHEDTIIRSLDLTKLRPQAIFFESHHLGTKRSGVMERLSGAGYAMRDIGGDSMAELPL